MRTTLELPDDLMRSLKVRAAQTDRTLTDVIAELLRTGLTAGETGPNAGRVQLPLVRTDRHASTEELGPERVAEILSESDVSSLAG